MVAQPHFLLFCDTHHSDRQPGADGRASGYEASGGRWHFVLEQLDGPERLEAADSEFAMNRERLALLSVVRGLEALEQPSQVTLVTTSRYVSRGLRYGIHTWRDNDYTWERFGEQRPVRNSDLWRRVDTALQFHGIQCRLIQAGQVSSPPFNARRNSSEPAVPCGAPATGGSQAASHPSPAGRAVVSDKPAPEPVGAASIRPIPSNRFKESGQIAGSTDLLHGRRGPAEHGLPPCVGRKAENSPIQWWDMAAAWIRWWRGRLSHRPAFYGT